MTTTTPNAQSTSSKRIGRLPHPFVKWAGGKRQLISSIEQKMPKHFLDYYEPFVGGGALFFHIHNSGRLGDLALTKRVNKVVLNDKNKDLIAAYRAIKDKVGDLIDELHKRRYENSQKRFHKMREWEPTDPVERAARLIYLNKTCYNGCVSSSADTGCCASVNECVYNGVCYGYGVNDSMRHFQCHGFGLNPNIRSNTKSVL